MAAPAASKPQLPVNALGYVDIAGFRPPASAAVPDEHDPLVQAALARATERRQPCAPLRVCPVERGFALVDLDSYREWWALRKTGSGIGQVKARWVELVETSGGAASAASLPARNQKKPAPLAPPASPAAHRPPPDGRLRQRRPGRVCRKRAQDP